MLALVPAVLVIAWTAEDEQSTQQLLVLSQVILSLQLSFAVIPLIHFTSNRRNMGSCATPWWGQALAWLTAGIIVALNGKLVLDKIAEWVSLAAESGSRVGPMPLSGVVGTALYGLTGVVGCLLAWVTLKPWVRPSPPWQPEPSVELDWAERPATPSLGDDRRGVGTQPGGRRDPEPSPESGPYGSDSPGLAPRGRHADDRRLWRRDRRPRDRGR